ncbi:alpha/beta hydrolase fold protein [Mycolicibacterium canariasense]|uniref:Alpha/beta hydrolase fold protein n=1 Tax=Mycolicibacterium canariasense TaxID=228230 RepID=A0A117IC95_MYCCR|nr:alpha/beta hydrolase [Mycolicibacterium canariasense]MCV7208161.1 alpha/beta hydrolase [Mycolicibacterium canariasense]ORV09498.1 hydrolase [Mycolicibacterium canariasense]GAS99095.1 alpha/beta hydrolase fold protein [Mycolicibacterium canariasense]
MTITDGLICRSLDVPGARLHYEVRGSGPLLLAIGSPMTAAEFLPLAHAMAADHTVVTYDPRGLGRSSIDDPEQDATPELRADDVAAILDALDAGSADVFGSSGGAVTGLALAARHPGRVRTLVAHEPPLLELLPDADRQRAATEEIIATFHRDGVEAAWLAFMANAGFDLEAPDAGPPPGPEPTPEQRAQQLADSARFFDRELRDTTRYVPDIAALTAGPARIVVGLGAQSGHLLTDTTTRALAALLHREPVIFPGDHGGFIGAPGEFADTLRAVLSGPA